MKALATGTSSPSKATARANSAAPPLFYQAHSPGPLDPIAYLTTSPDMGYTTTQRVFRLIQQLHLSPTEQPHQDHQIQRFTLRLYIRYKPLSVHSGAKAKQSASASYLTMKDLYEHSMGEPTQAQFSCCGRRDRASRIAASCQRMALSSTGTRRNPVRTQLRHVSPTQSLRPPPPIEWFNDLSEGTTKESFKEQGNTQGENALIKTRTSRRECRI